MQEPKEANLCKVGGRVSSTQGVWVIITCCVQIPKGLFNPRKRGQLSSNIREITTGNWSLVSLLLLFPAWKNKVTIIAVMRPTFLLDVFLICKEGWQAEAPVKPLKNGMWTNSGPHIQRCHFQPFLPVDMALSMWSNFLKNWDNCSIISSCKK